MQSRALLFIVVAAAGATVAAAWWTLGVGLDELSTPEIALIRPSETPEHLSEVPGESRRIGGANPIEAAPLAERVNLDVQGVLPNHAASSDLFVNARVELRARSGAPRVMRLDENLRTRFEQVDPSLTYDILVSPDRGVPSELQGVRLEPGEDRTINITLYTGATLFGRILDPQQRPAVGVHLQVRSEPSQGEVWNHTVRADGQGEFELQGVPPGRVTLKANQSGALELTHAIGLARNGETIGPIELFLEPGLALEGSVRWPDGLPAAGAYVAIAPADSETIAPTTPSTLTDSEGRFWISGLGAGLYDLVSHPKRGGGGQFVAWADSVAPGRVELEFVAGVSVSGTVISDHGEPASAFHVELELIGEGRPGHPLHRARIEELSSSDGTWQLSGLRPERYRVTASHPSGFGLVSLEVDLASSLSGVVLSLMRPAAVEGIVVDGDGRTRVGVLVYAVPVERPRTWGLRFPRRALTQSDGSFLIEGIAPGQVVLQTQRTQADGFKLTLKAGERRDGIRLELR